MSGSSGTEGRHRPDAWETLYQTKSRPFTRPAKGKIAVKVINHYGDEVLQVYDGLTGGVHRRAAGSDRHDRRAAADRGVCGIGQDPGHLAAHRRDPAPGRVEPKNIVAFTFTEKAAAELKERVTTLVTEAFGDMTGLAELFIGTMHGYARDALQTYVPRRSSGTCSTTSRPGCSSTGTAEPAVSPSPMRL